MTRAGRRGALAGLAALAAAALAASWSIRRAAASLPDFSELARAPGFVAYDGAPALLRGAVVYQEDRRFFGHGGLDLPSALRALSADAREGDWRYGASTLTQQAARLLKRLGRERSAQRKAREAFWALALEARYSKEEILALYLNYAEFAPGTQGVTEGARRLFGREPAALPPGECLLLAAQLPGPGSPRARERARGLAEALYQLEVLSFGEWRWAAASLGAAAEGGGS